jgi:thiamine-monophosphate kinase
MDISDGLVGDLRKLCEASGVAAVVDLAKVPVHPALREAFPERTQDLALYGGEDYELLFCATPDLFRAVGDRLRTLDLAPATAIGEIVAGEAGQVWLRDKGGQSPAPAFGGYDAFGKQAAR